MTRTELITTFATAALAFAGALGGVFLGSKLDQGNWERRFQLEQKRIVLERRVAITERVIAIVNKAPTMSMLSGLVEVEGMAGQLHVACLAERAKNDRPSKACKTIHEWTPDRAATVAKEANLLGVEFATSISLAAMYFGPETRSAVDALRGKEWWKLDILPTTQKLVDAMGRELNKFSE